MIRIIAVLFRPESRLDLDFEPTFRCLTLRNCQIGAQTVWHVCLLHAGLGADTSNRATRKKRRDMRPLIGGHTIAPTAAVGRVGGRRASIDRQLSSTGRSIAMGGLGPVAAKRCDDAARLLGARAVEAAIASSLFLYAGC